MNLWIIDSHKGIALVYYSSMGIFLDENIVSGLISALNQLTMIEFKQPIQSINMGGFKWIYVVDQETNLMFVMSDSIEVSTEVIKGRLNFLKRLFMKRFVPNKNVWRQEWTGDIEMFQPFKESIKNYHDQWTSAGNIDLLAEFYDMIGIFQEILNLTLNIIENHCFDEKKEDIYKKITEIFNSFKDDPMIIKEEELQNISFSSDLGYNIFEIDPMNCNTRFVKEQIRNLVEKIIFMLKKEIGYESCLLLFSKEEIFKYIYENFSLVKQLDLDKYILKLFLLE